jgi:H+-transporting ATPase
LLPKAASHFNGSSPTRSAKVRQVTYLGFGLLAPDHAILTPMLVVLSMITGDFLAMSSTTDNVRPSEKPNTWRIGNLTIAGVVLGLIDLAFCIGVLLVGKDYLRLELEPLRTLTMVNLVVSGQAIYYVVRERRRIWSSKPSAIVLASSLADLLIVPTMACDGAAFAPRYTERLRRSRRICIRPRRGEGAHFPGSGHAIANSSQP